MTPTRRQLLTLAAATTLAGPAPAARAASATPRLPAQKSLQLFGATLRYHELGRPGAGKPTLVLLHGLGSSAAGDWGQVMPQLARTHHVLAPDQLGFGQSDKPFIQYGIQTWVDFLGEFLREKRVADGFQLMGESLGGWIAAQYTLQALRGEAAGESFTLRKPGRLVLADAAGFREVMAAQFEKPAPGKGGAGPSLAGQKALLARIFRAPAFNTEAAIRNGLGWSISKGDSFTIAAVHANPAILNEAIDGQLAGITIPTLVVWGQHDELIPLALGERYAREIPGARLVVVPEAGHAPMIETPAAFLAALGDFLTRP
ncbi:MAG: alpha/beta hydrolase [Roseateles sp.]|uniref:alpha/beta fold hydrolase n=1 Tax=Roseateles sp. TaxID=1971397 RepID=UPI0039ED58DA